MYTQHDLSLMVFADNKEHVKQILLDIVKFGYECINKYNENMHDSIHYVDVRHKLGKLKEIEEQLKDNNIEITEINTNQIFKIGWADNDSI